MRTRGFHSNLSAALRRANTRPAAAKSRQGLSRRNLGVTGLALALPNSGSGGGDPPPDIARLREEARMARVRKARRRNVSEANIARRGGFASKGGLSRSVRAAFDAEIERSKKARSKKAKTSAKSSSRRVRTGKGSRPVVGRVGRMKLALKGSPRVAIVPEPVLVTRTNASRKNKGNKKGAKKNAWLKHLAPFGGISGFARLSKTKRDQIRKSYKAKQAKSGAVASPKRKSPKKKSPKKGTPRKAASPKKAAPRKTSKKRKSRKPSTARQAMTRHSPYLAGGPKAHKRKSRKPRYGSEYAAMPYQDNTKRIREITRELGSLHDVGITSGAKVEALRAERDRLEAGGRANRRKGRKGAKRKGVARRRRGVARRHNRKGARRRRNQGLFAQGGTLMRSLHSAGSLIGGAILGTLVQGATSQEIAGLKLGQILAVGGGAYLLASELGVIGKGRPVRSLQAALGNWKIGLGAGLVVSGIPMLHRQLLKLIPDSVQKYLPGLSDQMSLEADAAVAGYNYIDGGVYGVGDYVAANGLGAYVDAPDQAWEMTARNAGRNMDPQTGTMIAGLGNVSNLPVSVSVAPAGYVATNGMGSMHNVDVTVAPAGFGIDVVPGTAGFGIDVVPGTAGLGAFGALSADEVEEVKDAPELSDAELAREGLSNLTGNGRAYFKVVIATPDLASRLQQGGVACQASQAHPGAVVAAVPRAETKDSPSQSNEVPNSAGLPQAGRSLQNVIQYGGIFGESIFGPIDQLPGVQ